MSVRAIDARPLSGFAADRASAVRAMFREHADLFRLRPDTDDFQVAGEHELRGVHHLRMNQTWRGIPVRGGQYMVSVGGDGRVRMLGGRSVPDVDAELTPVVTDRQAILAAAASRHLSGTPAATASLAIEPAEGPDRLVWQVEIGAAGRAGEWEVLVDARDGSIVSLRSRAFGSTGCAAIWEPSPNAPRREDDFVIDTPLPDSAARLLGPQVRLHHETESEVSSVTIGPGGCFDFHFDPDTQPQAFDQVNTYWQVDHFLREFHGGNGFPGLPTPMTMFLHPFRCGDPNTAETIGNTVWITTGGCGYKSAGRDGDVIDHEVQHVVNNFFGLEGGLDLEREIYATALHESFANYFSCAAHDDPVYAEYFFGPAGFANCNSDPVEYNYSRRLEIGIGALQNYLVGMIWSGALWDIRKSIGPVIDRIALESLYYLPSAPSMHNAVDAVLQADRDLHQGQYQDAMIAAFATRGLGPGIPRASIGGPRQQQAGVAGTWTAEVCCGSPPYRYEWSRVDAGAATGVVIGSDDSVTVTSNTSFELRLRVADSEGRPVLAARGVTIVSTTPLLSVEIDGPRGVRAGVVNRWTARVDGQGSAPVTYKWTLLSASGIPQIPLGNTMSIETSLPASSILRVQAGAPGLGGVSRDVPVVVDRSPVATIPSARTELGFGERTSLTGSAVGGVTPYTWRWTRNGTGPENAIGGTQTIQVTGDSVAFDVYLSVTTALGLASNTVKLTIRPRNDPLAIEIDGPQQVEPNASRQWTARLQGYAPPNARYQWLRTCLDPGCLPELVGTGPSVTLESTRNFDLELRVAADVRTASRMRRIAVLGTPVVVIVAPEWLAPGEPVTLRAQVSSGQSPYSYRWGRDGLAEYQVIGTSSTLSLTGDGRDVDLYLSVTSADGAQSDAAHFVIRSGLGPRPAPDHPAFTADRTVLREGEDVTFTLEGRPGSSAQLRVMDVNGREVSSPFEGTLSDGRAFVPWRSDPLPSGVYLAVAWIADQRITRRLTVLR